MDRSGSWGPVVLWQAVVALIVRSWKGGGGGVRRVGWVREGRGGPLGRAHDPSTACSHTRFAPVQIYCVSTAFRYCLCEGECGSVGGGRSRMLPTVC